VGDPDGRFLKAEIQRIRRRHNRAFRLFVFGWLLICALILLAMILT
jgi:predicted nucleic acid-binding Zn ribbon protein